MEFRSSRLITEYHYSFAKCELRNSIHDSASPYLEDDIKSLRLLLPFAIGVVSSDQECGVTKLPITIFVTIFDYA